MKNSREIIAQCIGAQPEEIFFTSGGTESNNWAIKGIAFSDPVKHAFITSVIEHHAILRPCADIERMGHPVSYLPVDYTGTVNIETLAENINSDTRLVSVMTANNEIGSVQDIPALAAIAHSCGAIFHTDAVQAVGHGGLLGQAPICMTAVVDAFFVSGSLQMVIRHISPRCSP